jgi:outer membrane lipoprotein-sorting protein
MFGVLATALFVLLPSNQAHAADLDRLLDRWCAAQTNVQTWSADVTQTRSLKVLSQPLVATGKLWLAMPDRFRLELGQPAQTIVLRQPDQLLIMYPPLKRVEKYPLRDAQAGTWKDALALLEASFPQSRAVLESCFRVVSAVQTNSIVRLSLQPKSASARKFMTEILVSFHTNDFLPTATELKFSDGSSIRIDFTNAVLNAPLAEGLFEAKPAPDFKVVEPLRQ